ncbi:MAG: GNAT family N-acetyltransferase [Bacteroidota bacterium]|nr:GNAT family N-acetyltransferase [Bacteroidota bacterium]
MELTFKSLKSEEDIKELSDLASKIWNGHYPSIIGQKQVDYMLEKMYSLKSLKEQIFNEGNIFTGAYLDNEMVGFISYSKTSESDFFLHKLYVNTEIHGKGIGRALFDHAFENKNLKTIRLTVNRQNVKAINFYFKKGFTIEKIIDIDIGEGYVMDDFVMLYKK